MSDDMRSYTTRKVATRTPECQEQLDAAHKMPGTADTNPSSSPMQTQQAADAREAVQGRTGIPAQLPGTTFAKPPRKP